MILYHFSAMENVEAIQRDGLRALLQGSHDSSTILGTCDKPAVYLTDLPRRRKCFITAYRWPGSQSACRRMIGS